MTPSRAKAKNEYRFVGSHVDDLADGRTLEPGGFVTLSETDLEAPHNQRLLDEGLLIATNEKED